MDNFINPALLSPGNSPGTITVNGNYSPSSTASHYIEIGGTTSGNFDNIVVSGNISLNGSLTAVLYGGFTPSTNHDWQIITGSSVTGTFSSVNLPSGYSLVYNPTNVTLHYGTVLPVTFISLDAVKEGSLVDLTWKVAEQQNVLRYDIEKSTDGRNFLKIGSEAATSQTIYSHKDFQPQSRNFYRIKSVDLDGKYKYSSIVVFDGSKSSVVMKVYPVPAQNEIVLQHSTAQKDNLITIHSVDGRTIKTIVAETGTQQTSISIQEMDRGSYFISYQNGEGQLNTINFIKQ